MIVYSNRSKVPVYTDYRDNIIIDRDHPILSWKANKDRMQPGWFSAEVRSNYPQGLPKIASFHSEDALTWNVFRTLQQDNRVKCITDIFLPGFDTHKIYFWGHDADVQSEKIDADIQNSLNEIEPWGRDGRWQQTEPDLLLKSNDQIIMVECKLGEPEAEVKAWQRSKPGMRSEYDDFIHTLEATPFKNVFDYNRDGNRFYQLFRNYLLGISLALRWKTRFSLLAIVNDFNTNINGRSHLDEFSSFRSILTDPSNTYLISWQQIQGKLRNHEDLVSLTDYLSKHSFLKGAS